ncbi:glutathione S-transferase family protein [Alteromonas stellipolaris]|uniref:glutathione S-transferase family protein n=1 Tax=Alteromonas TaxID=226 RepID=UPI00077011B5|nr:MULTISPECIES: glutathione S-transferase family protein [Alteromonas]AMJ91184.1 glutathione S-transferase [Alteromonas sp. Mac2]AMJ87322.1 glutathione S-transferase [Alteromonas sp. Mac1]AMJ95070.1 glutathione S-transferase [Alteromonas stellipolaris]ANB24168.1 glutathione S-transferase [Alteromonas stellipolaris]MBZ2163755.1 glutathione S-transferase family protein [Alteromonas stellipolaris]
MKHYYNPMSRAVTTDWILKELDIKHEQIGIDFTTTTPELLQLKKINPMGKLPTLVDGETVVTEVAAICAYLADKYPEQKLAPDINSVNRATYYRYLFVAGNTIEPALTLAASQMEHPNSATAGWGDISRVISTIEIMTPEARWILGEQFTAADVVFGGLLDSSITFGTLKASSKVAAYVARIKQRPAYRDAHQAFIDLLKPI